MALWNFHNPQAIHSLKLGGISKGRDVSKAHVLKKSMNRRLLEEVGDRGGGGGA